MIFNVSGGGGTALNFRVVGNPQPENPSENAIWINTDVPITSYIFSATQPTGSAGMVWISVGTSSPVEFNALKKNGMQVYPISAKQYIGGAWVDKTAKSYQGGKWVDWIRWLFKDGNQYADITGGWDYSCQSQAKVTFGDKISVSYTGSSSGGAIYTKNKINVSGFSKVCARVKQTRGWDAKTWIAFGLHPTQYPSNYLTYDYVVSDSVTTLNTETVLELNVSNISGEYYLNFRINSVDVEIYEIWGV